VKVGAAVIHQHEPLTFGVFKAQYRAIRKGFDALMLDDRSGRIEVSLFDDIWQQHRAVVARDAILIVEGQLRFDEFIEDWRINAKKLTPIDEVRLREARRLVIRMPAADGDIRLMQRLEETLRPCRGGQCNVAVHYVSSEARATLALGDEWSVQPTRALLDELGLLSGGTACA
jgi:DNA polymerase-3 subunit alpha